MNVKLKFEAKVKVEWKSNLKVVSRSISKSNGIQNRSQGQCQA